MDWREGLGRILNAVPPDQVGDAICELARLKSGLELRHTTLTLENVMNAAHQPDPLLTPAEAARHLNTSVRWVQRHWSELGGIHVGKHLRFRRTALERYLERRSP
jgi:excisionase family DNA binding protein